MPTGPSGILPVDKPRGITSHDVVDRAREILGIRKVGHTGTLDPMATGVLVLCIGRYTRLSQYLVGQRKSYSVRIRFGVETDTLDAEGRVTARSGSLPQNLDEIVSVLSAFTGEIEQIPPMYSALKIGGRRLHEMARSGLEVAREPRRVTIHGIDSPAYDPPDLDVTVSCSKGTYIRVLAQDIGRRIGCGAHLAALRRTSVGAIGVDRCVELNDLHGLAEVGGLEEAFLDPAEALPDLPVVRLGASSVRSFVHGNSIALRATEDLPADTLIRVADECGCFLGIGKRSAEADWLQPVRVMADPLEADGYRDAPGRS